MSGNDRFEPALLSHGFRPFFLLAAVWAAGAIATWLWLLHAGTALPSRFDGLTWHIHEMLFGFVMAAIAGFLLTAVANWTGRPPARGLLSGILVGAWMAGRLACWFSAKLPAGFVIAADLALPVLLVAVVLREVIAARSWRNLPMVMPVGVLGTANLFMHLETLGVALPSGLVGWRLGVAAVIILVSAVAGRIVPAFTRNWLKKGGKGDLPPPRVLGQGISRASAHGPLGLGVFPERSDGGHPSRSWGWSKCLAVVALARYRDARGISASNSAYWLLLDGDRSRTSRLGYVILRSPSHSRYTCTDSWNGRHDDPGGHDPRHAWSHGPPFERRSPNERDLCFGASGRLCARGRR